MLPTLPGGDAVLPRYDLGGLAGVLPAVAASLGVPVDDPATVRQLPRADRAVVVLVDGLGGRLLEGRSGHAPFLRALLQAPEADLDLCVTAGFPTTTATSMGSFGTGLPPGAHGLTGYQVRVPGTQRLLNELSWRVGPPPLEDGPAPRCWQAQPTWFERAAQTDIAVTMVAPAEFDGSGLTRAALRGARFRAGDDLADRVDQALAALRADRRSLVYLYWGEIDRVGHVHGCRSWQWGDALELVDRELQRLCENLPAGTSLTVTADHGMVDVPANERIDLATDPELAAGVELTGGEMRALQLYCRPGAVGDVLATWRSRLGDRAWVLSCEQAMAAGLFGPVSEQVMPRLGDVVVAMNDPIGVYDSRVMSKTVVRLVGQHGSLTAAEQCIPLLHLSAA